MSVSVSSSSSHDQNSNSNNSQSSSQRSNIRPPQQPQKSTLDKNEFLCPISQEHFQDAWTTPFGHIFERNFILKNLSRTQKKNYSIDKEPVQEISLRANRIVTEVMAKIRKKLEDKEYYSPQELSIAERCIV